MTPALAQTLLLLGFVRVDDHDVYAPDYRHPCGAELFLHDLNREPSPAEVVAIVHRRAQALGSSEAKTGMRRALGLPS